MIDQRPSLFRPTVLGCFTTSRACGSSQLSILKEVPSSTEFNWLFVENVSPPPLPIARGRGGGGAGVGGGEGGRRGGSA